jgi:nucleoid-associated protein YgaU
VTGPAARAARGIGALAALVALVVGVPAFLVMAVGWPLPHSSFTLTDITDAVTGSTAIPDALWFGALACIGWVMWLRVAIAVLGETRAAFADRPAGERGLRRAVAPLVAAALLTLSTARTARPAVAAPVRPLPAIAAVAVTAPGPPPAAATTPATPTWTVARHDTLWDIAEQALGDPLRWHDIYDLNEGRPQPDGATLRDPSLVRPGWTLQLPADATIASSLASPATFVTVEPGDTLSGIAQRNLGDANRYPQLYAASAGITQPDGDHLTDPNLIRPGWRIRVPAPTTQPPATDRPATSAPPIAPAATTPAPSSASEQAAATVTSAAPAPFDTNDGASRPASDRDAGAPVALLATAGSAITAAAVLGAVRRRRRHQRALRPPGGTLPAPAPESTPYERQLRITSDDDALAWVDASGRLLGQVLAAVDDPPEVVLVRAGVLGVEVLLDRPAQPSPPFVLGDSPNTWQLAPALGLDDAVARGAGHGAAAPALVSIGATPEGTVLLNLEHAGTIGLTGDRERVAAWFRGAALELASAPWAAEVPIFTTGIALAGPDTADIHTVASRSAATDTVASHAARLRAALDGVNPRQARLRDPHEAWLPAVALIATPAPDETVESAAAGAIIVSTQPTPGPWRINIDSDGTASVAPLGLVLHAVGIGADTAAACADLVETAQAEPQPALPAPPVDPPPPGPAEDVAAQIDAVLAARPIEVRVLRPEPDVSGWTDPTRLRGKATELVVYLAMADGRVGAQRIRNDLWAGELVTNDTWKSTNSRARAALGTDAHGDFRLPHAEDSRFQLTDDVGCDWQRFRRLVALADDADPTSATAYLAAALHLIDGMPFSDCGSRYRWAEDRLAELDAVITDGARRLADLAVADGNPELATWATEQGHAANPEQQSLFDARMVARALAGDPDGVQRAYDGMRCALRRVDPLAEIPDEVAHAYTEALRVASSDTTRAAG